MSIENDQDTFQTRDSQVLAYVAAEDMERGDRVSVQANHTVVKNPNGAFEVYMPYTVKAGETVDVSEVFVGGSGGGGIDTKVSAASIDASNVLTLTISDGTSVTVDLSQLKDEGITFRGGINAGTDNLPATAGLGDAYVVTGDGNNFGDIKGVDFLSEDDILLFINSLGDNDASNPINWLGLQGNIDNRSLSSMSVEDDKQTVDLVANTGLQVDAVNLLNGDIRDVTLLDSNNFVITSGVQIQIFEKPDAATAPYVILTSNTDLNGVQVFLRGKA